MQQYTSQCKFIPSNNAEEAREVVYIFSEKNCTSFEIKIKIERKNLALWAT